MREKMLKSNTCETIFSSCSDNRKSKICVEQRRASKSKMAGALCHRCRLRLGGEAEAQQSKKVPRIGYLSVRSPSSDSTRIEAFRQGSARVGLR